jgi:hypothetical protein
MGRSRLLKMESTRITMETHRPWSIPSSMARRRRKRRRRRRPLQRAAEDWSLYKG